MSTKTLAIVVAKKTAHNHLSAEQFIRLLQRAIDDAGADWDESATIAALKKKGTSLQRVARLYGYHPTSLHHIFTRPWPGGEQIVAGELGLTPQQMFRSRYNSDGTPRSGRGQRVFRRQRRKHITRRAPGHVQRGL